MFLFVRRLGGPQPSGYRRVEVAVSIQYFTTQFQDLNINFSNFKICLRILKYFIELLNRQLNER